MCKNPDPPKNGVVVVFGLPEGLANETHIFIDPDTYQITLTITDVNVFDHISYAGNKEFFIRAIDSSSPQREGLITVIVSESVQCRAFMESQAK